MNKLITLSLSLLFIGSAFAQEGTEDYFNPEKPKLFSKDRVSASVSAGTGVSLFNKNTTFTTFVAPKINYRLTERFRLNVGFMHYTASGNSVMFLNRNEAIVNQTNQRTSGNLISVGGDYLVNKKLIISGAAMVDVNTLGNSKKQDQFKAVSVGAEYKLNNSSSIKFETTISDGQGSYYNNPFGTSLSNSMFDNGSGFGSSPGFR